MTTSAWPVRRSLSGADGSGGGLMSTSSPARAFAATFLLFVLAVGLYGLFALLERRVVRWR